MYLLSIHYENAKKNDAGEFCFETKRGEIRKWTLIPSGPKGRELLQLMALACGGPDFFARLPCDLHRFCRISGTPLHIEILLVRHSPYDGRSLTPHLFGSGIEINDGGQAKIVRKNDCRMLPSGISIFKPPLGSGNLKYLILGYGSQWRPHKNTDVFDFRDPFHRITRFHSLFSSDVPITDPIAFLFRLHYKAIRCSRFPAQQTIWRVGALFKEHLNIETGRWLEKRCDFEQEWYQLRPWQQRVALPILDAVRHIIDASPRSGTPLDRPGVLLLDRPDLFCTEKIFPCWITLMNRLLPAMQYVITLSGKARSNFPRSTQRKRLALPPAAVPTESKTKKTRLPRGTILLIDVDSRLPNPALMKLSRYYKEQGRKVVLARKGSKIKGAKGVYASSVFFSPASTRRVAALREYYGDSLIVGGSGVDIHSRLPEEIEKLPADYALYPELGDRAIGFITRGCPFKCPFCIVPVKEGKTHQVSNLEELLQNDKKKLILLDDNILSHPRADKFLEDMAVYHFSLNDTSNLDRVRRKYRQLGFTPKDNVEFICMYGYNTTLAEDVERFRFLQSLPGAYVFVQRYQPILGGPTPILEKFFDDNADKLINDLVKIIFAQNMKSMEKYYRWLSKLYVMTFGKLHMGLVDTIFRYNNRDHKGRYIATLAGAMKNLLLP
ncbi:MAG: hypothetical protein JRJ79_17425 [Deltaproteobacteria bacterium]|nr:hypothetical protein [Deltaproteobacteria bacterium]